MTYVPFSPELAAAYTITGPDGYVAAINQPLSANYAGVLTDLTGLDSPDVTDSGGTLVQGDGGYTGSNWYGRRPITMSVQTYGYETELQRDQQIARIRRATNAMTADGTLSWLNTATGSVLMSVPFRRTSPLRVTGGWAKTINISITSYIAPMISAPVVIAPTGSSFNAENQGDYSPGYIQNFTVAGPTAGAIQIKNITTNEIIQFVTGLVVPSGHTMTVTMAGLGAHTATLDGASVNQYIDYVNSTWPTMPTGNNAYSVNTGKLGITYNSAWI